MSYKHIVLQLFEPLFGARAYFQIGGERWTEVAKLLTKFKDTCNTQEEL